MNRQRRQSSEHRKRDTREKIELGGLIVKAGLRSADRAVLLGALIELKSRIDDRQEWLRLSAIGKDAFANDRQEDHAGDHATFADDRDPLDPERD